MKKLILTTAMALSSVAFAQESGTVIDLSGDLTKSNYEIETKHKERLKAAGSSYSTMTSLAIDNGIVTVDVAVWYSPVWETQLGTQEVIRRVDAWFDIANRGMAASDTPVRYNPIFMKPLVWDVRDQNPDCNSNDCTTLIQGTMDTVDYGSLMHTISENLPWSGTDEEPLSAQTSRLFGADLHVWFQGASDYDMENGPLGAAAYLGRTAMIADKTVAPTVIADELVSNALEATGLTLMHELGHNFGLDHQIESIADGVDTSGYEFAWSCGQGNKPGTATTVMWSLAYLGYESRNLLSNPNITRDGEACGDAQQADQARHVNEYAQTVATLAERPALTGTVSFDDATYTVLQGQTELVVNVTRTGDLSQYAEVQVVATDGSAVEGVDYAFSGEVIGDAQSYEYAGAVVTFQPNQATGFATIDITGADTSVTKSFDLALRFPLRLDTRDATATVVLQGDTNASQSSVISVDNVDFIMAENEEHVVTLTRTGDISGEATVRVKTLNGTGLAGVNYFALNDTVRFLPNEETAQFSVYSASTYDVSTFTINLSSELDVTFEQDVINVSVKRGQKGLATFAVTDNAEISSCLTDRPTDFNDDYVCGFYSEYENNTLSFPVTIERSNGSIGELTANIKLVDASAFESNTVYWEYVDPSAPILSADMVSFSEQSVTFADGELSKVITIDVTGLPETAAQEGFSFLIEIEHNEALTYTYKAGAQGFYVPSATMDNGGDDGDGGGDEEQPPFVGGSPAPEESSTSSGSLNGYFVFMAFLLICIRRLKSSLRY